MFTIPIKLHAFLIHITHALGDGEGGIEMTESMQMIRGFCDRLIVPEKATRTRVVSFLISSWICRISGVLYLLFLSIHLKNWEHFVCKMYECCSFLMLQLVKRWNWVVCMLIFFLSVLEVHNRIQYIYNHFHHLCLMIDINNQNKLFCDKSEAWGRCYLMKSAACKHVQHHPHPWEAHHGCPCMVGHHGLTCRIVYKIEFKKPGQLMSLCDLTQSKWCTFEDFEQTRMHGSRANC